MSVARSVNWVTCNAEPRMAFSKARVRSRLRRRAAVHTHCRVAKKSTCSDFIISAYTPLSGRQVEARDPQLSRGQMGAVGICWIATPTTIRFVASLLARERGLGETLRRQE